MSSALLAFLMRPDGGTAKIPREWVEASEWFVLFTLGTLLFLFATFAAWAWMIWKRTTHPKPHVRLLIELEEERENQSPKHAAISCGEEEPQTPWEQPADWWKKSDH